MRQLALLALLGEAQQQDEVTQGVITAVDVPQKLLGESSVETLRDAILVQTSVIHGESGGPGDRRGGKGGRDTASMEIGPQSDCYVALQVAQDLGSSSSSPKAPAYRAGALAAMLKRSSI